MIVKRDGHWYFVRAYEMKEISDNEEQFMKRISKDHNITQYDRNLLAGMKIKLDEEEMNG